MASPVKNNTKEELKNIQSNDAITSREAPEICGFSIDLSGLSFGTTTIEIPNLDDIKKVLEDFGVSINIGFTNVGKAITTISTDLTNIHTKLDVMINGLSGVVKAFADIEIGDNLPPLTLEACSI